MLFKRMDTSRQSSKTKNERLLSKDAYRLSTLSELPAKILIIDDIYTTGSTIIALKNY